MTTALCEVMRGATTVNIFPGRFQGKELCGRNLSVMEGLYYALPWLPSVEVRRQ